MKWRHLSLYISTTVLSSTTLLILYYLFPRLMQYSSMEIRKIGDLHVRRLGIPVDEHQDGVLICGILKRPRIAAYLFFVCDAFVESELSELCVLSMEGCSGRHVWLYLRYH